jgi:hypothetical protein
MSDLFASVSSWRFLSAVMLLAPFLGQWIFRKIPMPAEAIRQLERMQRAQVAAGVAHDAGINDVEQVAKLAGLASFVGTISSLKRQNRQSVVVGVVLAVVICALLFAYSDVSMLPGWVFIGAAAIGAYKLWKVW